MSKMQWPEITKDTPLTEVKRIHQQIWDYVIEHGEKPNTPYYYDCVGCEVAILFPKLFENPDTTCLDNIDYSFCPICWPENISNKKMCIRGGLYTKWFFTSGQEKANIARQIRDLPFKYELEEKQNV